MIKAIMHVAFGRVRRRIALLPTEFTHISMLTDYYAYL